ncbi:hypothetical protein CR513_23972, partial [Mucuna pruriens]
MEIKQILQKERLELIVKGCFLGSQDGLPNTIKNVSLLDSFLAVKRYNLPFDQASKKRKFQLQELEELHLEACEISNIYKEKNKTTDKIFKVNGHQLKPFHDIPTTVEGNVEDLSLFKPTFLEV